MKLFGNPIKGLVKTMLAFGFMSAMGVTPLFAQATNTLAGLVANNGTLTIGDKIFSGFSYTASGLTSFNPTNIIVTATGSNGIDYLTWSGNISLVSTGITSAVLLLKYIVTANRGVINMIDQSYSGSVTNGLLSVDETATSPGAPTAHSHLDAGFGPPDVSDPNVYPNGPFDIGENDLLSIVPAQTTLHVTNAISPAVISPSGGSVTITQVEQSFHQNSGTLANLVANNGTLTIGDKTFTNFTFEVTGLNSFNPTNIIVTATESNGVDYLTWSGNISLASGGFVTASLSLNYTVTANSGSISMIDQRYTGSVTNGSVLINETATSAGAPIVHSQLSVNDVSDPNTYPSGPFDVGENDLLSVTPPQTTLYVNKGISLVVIGGSITITQVEQSFHQVIPPTLAIQLVNPTNPMMVKVLWPSSSTNWTLWQNTNLVTTNWSSNSLSISNDNTNKSITVSPATGNLFFRLSNP